MAFFYSNGRVYTNQNDLHKPLLGNSANFLVCVGMLNMFRYSFVHSISKVNRIKI
jgi:plastocyanin domain-containing protein